jgi:hypothetical protein
MAFAMALGHFLILQRPPTGPRYARPEDKLRGRLEGCIAALQTSLIFANAQKVPGNAQ